MKDTKHILTQMGFEVYHIVFVNNKSVKTNAPVSRVERFVLTVDQALSRWPIYFLCISNVKNVLLECIINIYIERELSE